MKIVTDLEDKDETKLFLDGIALYSLIKKVETTCAGTKFFENIVTQ